MSRGSREETKRPLTNRLHLQRSESALIVDPYRSAPLGQWPSGSPGPAHHRRSIVLLSRIGRLVRRANRRVAEIQPLDRQEAEALLAAAASTPWLYPAVLCFLRAGLRRGELIG